jgi:hypothetical protein
MPDSPELSQARVVKQVTIVKHNHESLLNINSLICYMNTATNKRLLISKSHGDSNQCTPCRGTPHASHTQAMYGPRPYVSHTINKFEQIHYPREEGLPTQPTA